MLGPLIAGAPPLRLNQSTRPPRGGLVDCASRCRLPVAHEPHNGGLSRSMNRHAPAADTAAGTVLVPRPVPQFPGRAVLIPAVTVLTNGRCDQATHVRCGMVRPDLKARPEHGLTERHPRSMNHDQVE